MTGSAVTAVLRRPFSLPVMLSLALHGLAVAALGTFPLSTKVPPPPNDGIKVDLVVAQPAPVVRLKPVLSKPVVQKAAAPKARRVAVKRASPPRLTKVATSHARPAVMPVALPPVAPPPVVPVEQVAAFAEVPPSFMDLPRVPAPAAAPASVFAHATAFLVPEAMDAAETMAAFAVGGGEGFSFSRPLPGVSSGHARLLRDSTPEAGSMRSKVRPGNNPRPEYPRAAREAGWEGTVVLQVMVLPDGTAGNITLHKTSGHSILDEAALAAVKGWRFIPAMDGNFPIQSVVRMPVRFDLRAAN